ncbi:MAG: hypothetical protein ABI639_08445 [Thermoanaerobaculia bacterium]
MRRTQAFRARVRAGNWARAGRVLGLVVALQFSGRSSAEVGSLPAQPETFNVLYELGLPDVREPLTDLQRERIVALFYRRFEQVMRMSGFQVEIRTSDFRMIPFEQFGTFRAIDAQTYDSAWQLRVVPRTSSSNGEFGFITYAPLWEPTPNLPDEMEGADLSLAESLDESAAIVKDFEIPMSITTLRVQLAFAGRVLDYRAMFSWMSPDASGLARWRADDRNILFLNEACAENRRIEPQPARQAPAF